MASAGRVRCRGYVCWALWSMALLPSCQPAQLASRISEHVNPGENLWNSERADFLLPDSHAGVGRFSGFAKRNVENAHACVRRAANGRFHLGIDSISTS